MNRDEIVEKARSVIQPLGQGKLTEIGIKLRDEFTRLGKEARADAERIAMQIEVEHDSLTEPELQGLSARLDQLQTEARLCSERAERYSEFKRTARQITFSRSLR